MRILAVVLLVVTGVGGSALADDVDSARDHYRKGTRAYELGLYDEAVTEYTAAYKAKDDPVILYNMAQAHKLAGHAADALRLYRMFLIKVPNTPNRKEIVAKISALEELVEQQRKAQAMPPDATLPPRTGPVTAPEEPPPAAAPAEPPPPAPPVDTPPPKVASRRAPAMKIAGLTVAVVGVALCATGGAFLALEAREFDELNSPKPGYVFRPSTESALHRDQVLGPTLVGIGAAAAVAGTVVAVLGFREAKRSRMAFTPTVGTINGIALSGSFGGGL